ncbi:phytoene/squalene synthase family protein [Aeromicrobium phragmitis]|uniref:phytoene/squalene synthase family protein n=1 Tax=Aeromicrobium phragmitis TaxID=2478914 RepID=UPI00140CC92F|nr:squalene/phytoene synthase family protein [Aeromicrobium phragmitis]
MSLFAFRPAAPASATSRYDAVAEASAALVLKRYSTSFGIASRLLAEPTRTHVRNVYALVRVADEIVDARPPRDPMSQHRLLDALEADVGSALHEGHSANLVVHAFARTARSCSIEPALVTPFFASMRTDLERREHDAESFARYVYGSAEVVGLMCLRTFLVGYPEGRYEALAPGARRLGAAFQKVNFLRDLAEDHQELGRHYFPGLEPDALTDAQRDALLDDIDDDLRAADVAVRGLPPSSRRAVQVAHALFAELSWRLRRTPAAEIARHRVRVPAPVKLRVVTNALVKGDT